MDDWKQGELGSVKLVRASRLKNKVRVRCESRGRAGACMTGKGTRYSLEKKKDALSMDGSKKRKRIPREANDDTGMKTHVEPCRSE